jgi:hypothetical protein
VFLDERNRRKNFVAPREGNAVAAPLSSALKRSIGRDASVTVLLPIAEAALARKEE